MNNKPISGHTVRMGDQDAAEPDHPFTQRMVDLANDCVAAAESALTTLMPDLADQLVSSTEACGVETLISRRSVARDISFNTGQIAGGLAGQAHELRWPHWRDDIPPPPTRTCQSCGTEFGFHLKAEWQWCPACRAALD